MQTTYAQKNDTVQKASANTGESVADSSSQSATLQRHASLAAEVAQRAPEPRPNLTGMPDDLKTGIESLSGFSMDDVRVHYNSSKPATVQALAYTQGTDIHVAPGQEKCLPHEAWHVAQQMAGRVSPTTNINGMPVNDNAALEHEADVMGEKAVSQRKENTETKSKNVNGSALQLKPGGDVDLVCAADVFYRIDGKTKHVKGVGYNNPDDANKVLEEFKTHGLTRLANGSEYDNGVTQIMKNKNKGMSISPDQEQILSEYNPAGQCAEPHAFANALKNRDEISVGNIIDVFISESVIRKLPEKKGENPHDAISNVSSGVEKEKSIKTYSRCKTCAQWIQDDGHVKPSFLGKTSSSERGYAGHNSELCESRLYKYNHREGVNGIMEFAERDCCYINFFEPEMKEKFPNWFTIDNESNGINDQKNIRTIIKKQLLKNRSCEIVNKTDDCFSRLCTESLPECIKKDECYGKKIKELDDARQKFTQMKPVNEIKEIVNKIFERSPRKEGPFIKFLDDTKTKDLALSEFKQMLMEYGMEKFDEDVIKKIDSSKNKDLKNSLIAICKKVVQNEVESDGAFKKICEEILKAEKQIKFQRKNENVTITYVNGEESISVSSLVEMLEPCKEVNQDVLNNFKTAINSESIEQGKLENAFKNLYLEIRSISNGEESDRKGKIGECRTCVAREGKNVDCMLDEISKNVKVSRWEADVEKIKDAEKLTITQIKDILKRNYLSENELDYLRNKTGVEIKEDDAVLAME